MKTHKTIHEISRELLAARKALLAKVVEEQKYLGDIRPYLVAYDTVRDDVIEREEWDYTPYPLILFAIDHDQQHIELSVELEADVYASKEAFREDEIDDRYYEEVLIF